MLRSMRSLKQLVTEALRDTPWTWHEDSGRTTINVPTEFGRSQQVFVEETSEGQWSERLVRIYSPCAPVDEGYMRRALELNARIPFGSLAIQDVGGRPYFVMLASYPYVTCDPEEVQHSVRDIAVWADDVERALTGDDLH